MSEALNILHTHKLCEHILIHPKLILFQLYVLICIHLYLILHIYYLSYFAHVFLSLIFVGCLFWTPKSLFLR